jgi:hypothetical protein
MLNSFEDKDNPPLSLDLLSTAQGRPHMRFEQYWQEIRSHEM